MSNSLIERIFMLIEKSGKTPATISREIPLTNGLITQWKQGKQTPSLNAITKIANYFHVSIDYLVTGEEYSLAELKRPVLSARHVANDGTPLEYLCERVKNLCDATHTTFNELEESIGIDKNTITLWLKAKTLPSGDKILGIANHFDVSTDYLLGNTDNPKSHKNRNELALDFQKSLQKLASTTKDVQNYLDSYLLLAKENADDTECRYR